MLVDNEKVREMSAEAEGEKYTPSKPQAPTAEKHREYGSVGGLMVRRMIEAYERSLK